jgi:hypothetical protein
MAFSDQYTLANTATHRQKVQIAMCKVATMVVGEAPTASNRRDEKRHALGVAILADGGVSKLDAFAYACGGIGTLSGTSTDNDIEFVVTSVYSDIAGVTGGEA